LTFAVDKILSLFSPTHVRFVNVKCKKADLTLLAGWLADGLQVPMDSTISVRDAAKGLTRLKNGEVLGRVGIEVANQLKA
jgi:hypothetical protein